MVAVLIIVTLGILAFGYVIMGRIDNFFGDRQVGINQFKSESIVLIYGPESITASLEVLLSDKQLSYMTIREPSIPENMEISAVIAISDNDLNNLLLCNKARHLFPGVCLTAKCNEMIYRGIFEDTRIDNILTGTLTSEAVVSGIFDASYLQKVR